MTVTEAALNVTALLHHVTSFLTFRETTLLRSVSRCFRDNVDASTTHFKVANADNLPFLESYCLKLTNLQHVDFSNLKWSTKPKVFKAFSSCTTITTFHDVFVRCESSARAFTRLLKCQTRPLNHLTLYICGTHLGLKDVPPTRSLELHVRHEILSNQSLSNLLKRCGHRLTKFKLGLEHHTYCTLEKCVCTFHTVFQTILTHCTHLQQIELDVPCLGKPFTTNTRKPTPLQSFVVCNSVIGPDWSSAFFALNHENLSHLDICDIASSTFEEALLCFLKSDTCPPLSSVCWKNYWRTRQDLLEPQLVKTLAQGPCVHSIRALCFEGQFLSAQAVSALPDLKHTLTSLSLSNARIASLPFEVLCSAVGQMTNLQALDVSGLFLESEMNTLLLHLATVPHLHTINLSSSTIQAQPFVTFVNNHHSTIRSITASYCVPDESTLYYILEHVAFLPALHTLNLVCYCSLAYQSSAQYAFLLSKALRRMPSIEYLTACAPPAAFLGILIDVVRNNTKFRRLTLRVPVDSRNQYDHFVKTTSKILWEGLPGVQVNVY